MPGVGLKFLQLVLTKLDAVDGYPETVPWLYLHLQQALMLGRPFNRDVLMLALHQARYGTYDALARKFCSAWLLWNGCEVDAPVEALGRFYGHAATLQTMDGQIRGGVFDLLDNPGTFVEQVRRVSASRAKRVGDRGAAILAKLNEVRLLDSCKSLSPEQRAAFWSGFDLTFQGQKK